MKKIKILASTYTMTPTGKGQYEVIRTNKQGTKKRHSTASLTYDWMDDNSDRTKHAAAKRNLRLMFKY